MIDKILNIIFSLAEVNVVESNMQKKSTFSLQVQYFVTTVGDGKFIMFSQFAYMALLSTFLFAFMVDFGKYQQHIQCTVSMLLFSMECMV